MSDFARVYKPKKMEPSHEELLEPPLPAARAPPRKLQWWLLPLLIFLTLVSGTGVIILQKLMNKQEVRPCAGCAPRVFSSPMWQTLVMFAGREFSTRCHAERLGYIVESY